MFLKLPVTALAIHRKRYGYLAQSISKELE
jgi:hypothetical protein